MVGLDSITIFLNYNHMQDITKLPSKYEWAYLKTEPKQIVEAFKHFGLKEGIGEKNNPTILAWAKEVGGKVADVYKADSIAWCFGAGTLVDTPEGVMSIENLKVGEQVVGHDGKFHRIEQVLTRQKETCVLKAMGIIDTITTEDHPYLVRKRLPNSYHQGKRIRNWAPQQWISIRDISRGDMIAIPLKQALIEAEEVSKEVAYLLGIYVAEGTGRESVRGDSKRGVRANSASICLHIGKHEVERLKQACRNAEIRQATFTERRTCYQIEIRDRDFVNACRKFGRIAIEKHIPNEVFSWPREIQKNLLEGYISGDGHYVKKLGRTDCSTISKPLALSLSKLARGLGLHPTIRHDYRAGEHVIEGRTVQVRDRYIVQWSDKVHKQQWFEEGGYLWVPVREIISTGRRETVYDLAVDECHSFVANGAIVHNCGLFMALVIQRSRGAKEVVKDPLWALNWGTYGIKAATPSFGDILVFIRKDGGHVGLYIAEDKDAFHVLGGNTADSVSITRILKTRLYQARRPDYKIGKPRSVRPYYMAPNGEVSTNEA